MKLVKEKYTDINNFAGTGREFKVKVDSKLFQAQITGNYNDLVGAVVREVVANAVDAQFSNGSTAAIKVHLPNALEPYLEVQDFGCGIAPDKEEYYTLNASDKDDSDEVIGAFGLGSKTPFILCNQFTMTTHWDGMKYVYNCYYAGNGIPIFQLVHSEASDEVGTTVRVSVDINKHRPEEFVKAAKHYLRFLPAKLEFSGQNVTLDEVSYDAGDYLTLKNQTPYDYILIGNIPYRNTNSIEGPGLGSWGKTTLPFILKFPLDAGLTIARSRETVQQNAENKEIIEKKYKEVVDRESAKLKVKLDACPDIIEAAKLFENSGLSNIADFSYRNIAPVPHMRGWRGKHIVLEMNYHRRQKDRVYLDERSELYPNELAGMDEVIAFDEELDKKEKSAISAYMRANNIKELWSIYENAALFGDKVKKFSDLTIPKKLKSKTSSVYTRSFKGMTSRGGYAREASLDFNKPGIYVYGTEKETFYKDGKKIDEYYITEFLQEFKIKKPVWILRQNEIKKLPRNWIFLWDLIDKLVEKYRGTIEENSTYLLSRKDQNLANLLYPETIDVTSKDSSLRKFSSFDYKIPEKIEAILEKYPLLKALNAYEIFDNQGAVLEYVQLKEGTSENCPCKRSSSKNKVETP